MNQSLATPSWRSCSCSGNGERLDSHEMSARTGKHGSQRLHAEESRALDERGFVVLRGLIDAAWLGRLRSAFEGAEAEVQGAKGSEVGTRHVECVLAPGSPFLGLLRAARVLAAVGHMLARPYRLFQLGGREPGLGGGLQGLHADWPPRTRAERAHVVTCLWMLDDFLPDNGATRLVPGTHRLPGLPPRRFAQPAAHHPEEILVTGAAGDVLIFNGHTWHSGTRNQSGARRRALQAIFGARDQTWHGSPPTARAAELEPDVRALLEG